VGDYRSAVSGSFSVCAFIRTQQQRMLACVGVFWCVRGVCVCVWGGGGGRKGVCWGRACLSFTGEGIATSNAVSRVRQSVRTLLQGAGLVVTSRGGWTDMGHTCACRGGSYQQRCDHVHQSRHTLMLTPEQCKHLAGGVVE
jgi:hypothetical protein